LLDWKVINLNYGPDGSESYSVATSMTWSSIEGLQKALAGESAALMVEDMKNLTDRSPIFLAGTVSSSGQKESEQWSNVQ
jgi:hypothetical protein